jgi:hypothetical protein
MSRDAGDLSVLPVPADVVGELRALRRLLAVCGIAPEGSDAADTAPNRTRDLERVTSYVEGLQAQLVLEQLARDVRDRGEGLSRLVLEQLACTCGLDGRCPKCFPLVGSGS